MSQENVDNFLLAVEAFNVRDADAFVALASADVEWEDAMFGSEVSRIYRGREELKEWFKQVSEPWESPHVEIQEITEAADDRLLVGMLLTARGKSSGVDAPGLHFWQVNEFMDGKTRRRQVFFERAEALDAAGLRE